VSAITPAASVLLSRGPGSREIYAILRSAHLRFFGGFWAFPGGKLTPAEAQAADSIHARRVAACRELFEETGILIVRDANGNYPPFHPELADSRQRLLDESLPFEQFLANHGWHVQAEDFALIGEITTPAFAPQRYATTFFVAHVPTGQVTNVWPGELERGEWIDVRDLLARWHRGEAHLTPPCALALETLADRAVDELPALLAPIYERLSQGALHPIFLAPYVQMIPLKTAALPPSSYTNSYLIGRDPCYLLDPGAHDAEEQRLLFDALDDQFAAGRKLAAVVLSHQHPDHIGAANAVAERYGAPIWTHPITAQTLQGRIKIARQISDGERLDLGMTPAADEAWTLEAMHTPGHAAGHLAFRDSYYHLLFAGDMVSTLSSMVIAPPDGNLSEYLCSLHRLRELPTRMLLPSHGNVTLHAKKLLDDAIEHRIKRERQLLDELANGPASIDEMTARMYRGTPETLMRFARAQVLAGLLKLQTEGRATPLDQDRWQAPV
jgi:ribonuclease/clavin/mitogillin